MKLKRYFAFFLSILLIASIFSGCTNHKYTNSKLDEVFEYVFDAGIYKNLDYEFAKEYFKENYDNYGGGCTAVAKVNKDGDTIVGRNLDLNISNKPAYVYRTNVKGCYKTIGLTYTFRDISPDYNVVKKDGLPNDFAKLLPFMADDVLNEKGLYIELNMRNAEFKENGESKFSCSGTNSQSDERVYMFEIPRYIGEHCATVDEALEYVKGLNIYSKNGYWNYSFLIADSTGKYGVLEIAENNLFWNENQQCHTNFYINPDWNSIEKYKAGLGRYNKVMQNIDEVETQDQMFELMDSVSYFQFYNLRVCKFDYRSENVGALSYATTDFLMDEKNAKWIKDLLTEYGDYVRSLNRTQLQDANQFWESSFTEVINCNEKTIFVRFFENDEKKMVLSFDF